MFCGWRLTTSKNRLVELGSGILEIHILTGDCFFGGAPINSLPIGREIQQWFKKELAAQNIQPETIVRARIKATIQFSLIPCLERQYKEQVFFTDNQQVQTNKMHRCTIACESEITTEKASYSSRLSDVEEWPMDWPKPGWSYSKPT